MLILCQLVAKRANAYKPVHLGVFVSIRSKLLRNASAWQYSTCKNKDMHFGVGVSVYRN